MAIGYFAEFVVGQQTSDVDLFVFDELSSDSGHSLALVSLVPCNQY